MIFLTKDTENNDKMYIIHFAKQKIYIKTDNLECIF